MLTRTTAGPSNIANRINKINQSLSNVERIEEVCVNVTKKKKEGDAFRGLYAVNSFLFFLFFSRKWSRRFLISRWALLLRFEELKGTVWDNNSYVRSLEVSFAYANVRKRRTSRWKKVFKMASTLSRMLRGNFTHWCALESGELAERLQKVDFKLYIAILVPGSRLMLRSFSRE